MKGNITLHVHGLMVCDGQYNTFLWEESFRWLHIAAGPLDVPLSQFLLLVFSVYTSYVCNRLQSYLLYLLFSFQCFLQNISKKLILTFSALIPVSYSKELQRLQIVICFKTNRDIRPLHEMVC